MADHRLRLAAVDTRFLLDLGSYDEDAQEVCDGLNRLRFHLIVTSATLQDIQEARINSADPTTKELAEATLCDYKLWLVLDSPLPTPYDEVAEIIAHKLIDRKILVDPILNDAKVLSESSLHECQILVTHRQSLLRAHKEILSVTMLEENSVSMPMIVEKNSILQAFRHSALEE